MRRVTVLALTTALVVGIVAIGASERVIAAATSPFTLGRCPDVVPASTSPGSRVACGTLTVPEDRAHPSRAKVRLAVAVIHPAGAKASGATPLLYVSGGPGDAALPAVQFFLEQPFVTDRDMVVVDLRGTGSSEPSLACPEVYEVDGLAVRTDDPSGQAEYLRALTACRKRLVQSGVDLAAYDYSESAADLADLRRALGIAEWDVYGISNGGRLALELVRRHPEGIRSLVLDSALPPQGNYYTELWPHGARAFHALFTACVNDAACNAAHPDLEQRFWKLIDSLRKQPVTVTVTDPTTGKPRKAVFDDLRLLEVVRGALYDTSIIPIIPGVLDQLTKGNSFDFVAEQILARQDGPDVFSDGEMFSDNCREEVAFIGSGELPRLARAMPKFRRAITDEDQVIRAQCRVWNVGKAAGSVDLPVRSRIPALALSGSLDPVHPRSSSDAIAKYLPRSQIVELPGIGHGTAFASDCSRTLLRAFVIDPRAKLDTSCVVAIPPVKFS